MSITVKDVADMVERVDEKLSPLTRYDGFQPYEGIYRLGDWGYVTETEYNKAFEHEDGWAQDAYILDGNGVSHTRISQLINEDDTGKAISDYINERFNNDQMDDVSTPKPPKRVNAESLLAAYLFQKINQNRIFTSEVNQNEEADQ